MLKFFERLFAENLLLKMISLILAVGLWFYIVSDLNKGTEEERLIIQKLLPSYGMITKKLAIRPVLVGNPKHGYRVVEDQIAIMPEYCIVVGPRSVLNNVRYIYTLPIDVSDSEKLITSSVPLKPIAPGIYVEETLVTADIPIERIQR